MIASPRTALTLALALMVTVQANANSSANNHPLNPGEQATLDILKELHHTRALLEHSDHDYKGHRHNAVKDLTQAIKQLHESLPAHHHHHVQAIAKAHANNKPGKLSQEQSDAHLQKARSQLKTVETQLAKFDGPHHQKALVDVAKAIENLDTALRIK